MMKSDIFRPLAATLGLAVVACASPALSGGDTNLRTAEGSCATVAQASLETEVQQIAEPLEVLPLWCARRAGKIDLLSGRCGATWTLTAPTTITAENLRFWVVCALTRAQPDATVQVEVQPEHAVWTLRVHITPTEEADKLWQRIASGGRWAQALAKPKEMPATTEPRHR